MEKKELALRLKDAGFPAHTRLAAELNLRRPINVNPETISLPFLEEIASEIKVAFYLQKMGENVWLASVGMDESYYDIAELGEEQDFDSYVDERTGHNCQGKTAVEALGELYIALKNHSNSPL